MRLRPTLLLAALAIAPLAWGEASAPPERLAQLSYIEGQVTFESAQDPAGSSLPERPLTSGDRLATDSGARAEIALGTAALRLDEQSELEILDLDATTVRAGLNAGSASVTLREMLEDETFAIATPTTVITLDGPGEYRVDVPSDDISVITVRSGAAELETAGGPVRIAEGQRVRATGRDALANLETPRPADAFDDWVLERELQLAAAEPPRDALESEALAQYGEWYDEPDYGRVWMPAYVRSSWAPYGVGYWRRVGLGWTWVDPSPWSRFTHHRGRWAYLHHLDRWCWVPRQRNHGPHFAGDTAPFGHPRSDAPSRGDRDERNRRRDRDNRDGDATPAVVQQTVEDLWRQPVGKSVATANRTAAGQRPAPRRTVATSEQPRSGTLVPSASRSSSAPRPSSAATQSQDSGKTTRPSGTPSSRKSAASSSTITPRSSREMAARPLP
ncbi:MAG: DUF6600 domain-containing protein [Steroidobacteraceae bacterium]